MGSSVEQGILNSTQEIMGSSVQQETINLPVEQAIIVSIIIVGFGLAIHLTLGFLRAIANWEDEKAKVEKDNAEKGKVEKDKENPPKKPTFSKHKALRSIIVGSITGLVLVLPQAQKMGGNVVEDLILGVTLVGTVAGIDAIAKKSGLGGK